MNLKKILRQYKDFILLGTLLLFSVAGILFGVIPIAEKTSTVWQQVTALTSDVALLKAKTGILQSFDEPTLRGYVLSLASAVPSDKSLPTIFTTLNTVAGETNVAVTDFTLTKAGSLATASASKLTVDEAKIGSNLLPFSVNIAGTYAQIQSFLTTIVSVRRMFGLRSVDLSIHPGVATARVDLDAFYLPYPTTVGSIETVNALTDAEQHTLTTVGTIPLDSTDANAVYAATTPSGKADPFSL